jgi:tetratricopeptide (TPR) repeat protein
MTALNRTVILRVIGILFLFGNVSGWAVPGPSDPKVNPDAFVYILSIGIQAKTNAFTYSGLRNGFAVGDGQYVLTAAHCVDDFENSNHKLSQPFVLSLYYGDVFEAEIVAVDKENDVAILKPSWDIHPALELETSEQWQNSKTITIAGYPPQRKDRGGNGKTNSRNVKFETVPLVNTNGDALMAVQVGPVKYAGEGWSGSPLILPETGRVAGITCVKTPETKSLRVRVLLEFKIPCSEKTYISGCDTAAIRSLFAENHLAFETAPPAFEEINRRRGFETILSVLDTFKPDNEKQIETAFLTLSKEMPDSYFACASTGLALGPVDSKLSFEKSLEIDPESIFVRAVYGSKLLSQNKPQEAAEQFQFITARDPNHLFAYHGQLTALAQSDPNAGEALGEELTQRWPQNAGFWFAYSKALKANHRRSEELTMIQKAIALSETVPYLYQRHLADSLTANHHYEEARQAYQLLLKTHECERCWQANLSLLLKMGPDRASEAKRAMEKAKSLHTDPNTIPETYAEYEQTLEKMLSANVL